MSQHIFSSKGIDEVKRYQENSEAQKQHAMLCLKDFEIRKTDRVLDVGCGDGKITDYMAEMACEGLVVGLDISKQMIDLASSNYKRFNLLFMLGSGDQMPFINSFDKITSFMSFHWIEDQKRALHSFYKSLNFGGKIFITLPAECPGRASVAMQVVSERKEWQEYFNNKKMKKNYLSPDQFLQILEETNFVVDKIEVKEGKTHFDNLQAYKNWVRPLITGICHLSEDNQKRYLNDVMDELMTVRTENADKTITVRYQAINVVANKENRPINKSRLI